MENQNNHIEIAKHQENFQRVTGKKIHVTYSHSGTLSLTSVLYFLKTRFGKNLHQYYIVKALHENKEYHIHAFLKFVKRTDFKTSKCFDIPHQQTTIKGFVQKVGREESNDQILLEYLKEQQIEVLCNMQEITPFPKIAELYHKCLNEYHGDADQLITFLIQEYPDHMDKFPRVKSTINNILVSQQKLLETKKNLKDQLEKSTIFL